MGRHTSTEGVWSEEDDDELRAKEDAAGAIRFQMDPQKPGFGKEAPRKPVRLERKEGAVMTGLGAEEARKALENM